MSLRDVALCALTYPDATPEAAIDAGVALARRLGGELSLLTVAVRVPMPTGAFTALALGGEDRLAEENGLSRAAAQQLADVAAGAAARLEQQLTHVAMTGVLLEEAPLLCRAARTRDVCLMPVGEAVAASRSIAEAMIVGGGRPVLIYPETLACGASGHGFRRMAVAWDGSAAAARAVGSALPVLRDAALVRIVVTGEAGQNADPDALAAHLRHHGIFARIDHWPQAGQSVGATLADYVAAEDVELLVMGGYGHSRAREALLGGATRHLVDATPVPVWISH